MLLRKPGNTPRYTKLLRLFPLHYLKILNTLRSNNQYQKKNIMFILLEKQAIWLPRTMP